MKKNILLFSLLLLPGSTVCMHKRSFKKRVKKIKRKLSKPFKRKKSDSYMLKSHVGAKIAKHIPGVKQAHRARLEAQGRHLIKKLIPHMVAGSVCLASYGVLRFVEQDALSLAPLIALIVVFAHAAPKIEKLAKIGADLVEIG